ncbi:septum formation initiator [Subtercola sp. Z020]|uniref:S1C family serine protease n=1 Tax=Subtercola sp. Z020 TaxID=2080582 RepID=UPI000CE92DBC|nr:trypsin-like peptidase domain-containing protein [Subtercola sp. Z020]PPF86982.1 septum formation initiator [Subtercola sp. Z020]
METPEIAPQPESELQTSAPAAAGATTRGKRFWRPRNFLILGASAAAIAVACTSVGVTFGVGVPLALQAASAVTSTGDSSAASRYLDTTGGSGTTTLPNGGAGSGSSGSTGGRGHGYSFGGGSTGSSGSGSSGSTGTGSSTPAATDATDAQGVGVVFIDTELKYEGAAAAGTGIILTSDGEILTNNHVVEGSTSITVTVATSGKTYTAKVVGTDATNDVAVLKLEGASGLTPATLDTSEALAVGDQITGVGNAGGTGTLSAAAGTVTGLDQSVTTQAEGSSAGETLDGMIQVAADIQSGDSGGPLYDADGEVVGIDTAASSGSADVTGFAIPITDALDIAKQIASGTETSTVTLGYPAFLGIEVAGDASTSGGAGSLGSGSLGSGSAGGAGSAGGSAGSAGSAGSVAGATVAGVIAGTPAETAGLVAGDVITAVDGTSVASGSALTTTLKGYEPGNTVTITYTDAAGASHTVKATLVEGPVA